MTRGRLRPYVQTALLLALGLWGCGSPTAPGRALESDIRTFVGVSAKSCGRLGTTASEAEMQAALACAIDASRAGVAFSLVRQYVGTDSFVAEGLLGRSGGSMFKFSYDGDLGNRVPATFRTDPCNTPHLTTRGTQVFFAC
jgi:hypothetical protein